MGLKMYKSQVIMVRLGYIKTVFTNIKKSLPNPSYSVTTLVNIKFSKIQTNPLKVSSREGGKAGWKKTPIYWDPLAAHLNSVSAA